MKSAVTSEKEDNLPSSLFSPAETSTSSDRSNPNETQRMSETMGGSRLTPHLTAAPRACAFPYQHLSETITTNPLLPLKQIKYLLRQLYLE